MKENHLAALCKGHTREIERNQEDEEEEVKEKEEDEEEEEKEEEGKKSRARKDGAKAVRVGKTTETEQMFFFGMDLLEFEPVILREVNGKKETLGE